MGTDHTFSFGVRSYAPRAGHRAARGTVLIYSIIIMTALLLFASMGVDLGHVQVAKSQLENATDGAARYAATGLRSTMLSVSGAYANATAALNEDVVDGTAVPFTPTTDLTLGTWNTSTRTFTAVTDPTTANAVKLDTTMTLGTSTHPLSFLSIFGRTVTIHAESIAMTTGSDASTYVSAMGNAWLSGMPSGTVNKDFRTDSSQWDTAGSGPNNQSSPAQISLASLNATAGSNIIFDGVTGSTNYGGGTTGNADGDPNSIITLGSDYFGDYTYFNSPNNGMANIKAPINAMIAVFLDDNLPTSTAAPAPLDFSTSTARDYTSLSPLLKQPFFVGDARRSTGEVQQIQVPAGATRVFISNFDGWQYNNNTGGFNLTIHAITKVSTVKVK